MCQLICSASLLLQNLLIYMRFIDFKVECDLKTSVVVEMNLKPFTAATALAKHSEYKYTFALMLECSVECVKIGNPFDLKRKHSKRLLMYNEVCRYVCQTATAKRSCCSKHTRISCVSPQV